MSPKKLIATIVACALPVVTAQSVFAQNSAAKQFNEVIKNTNSSAYVQENLTQVEHLTYQGQTVAFTTKSSVRAHIEKNAFEEYSTLTANIGASSMHEQIYAKNGTVYLNTGNGWTAQGHISAKDLLSLSQLASSAFTNIRVTHTKSGLTFTAAENPNGFASMIERVLSMVTQSASANSGSINAKVLAQIFKNANAKTTIFASKVNGAERITKQTLALSLTINPAQLQQLGGQTGSGSQTVTSAVYGSKGSPLSMQLQETVTMTYAKLSVPTPKGLPKK